MMPCGSGWGFHPKQGLVTLPRFPQPLSAPAGSRVTRPLLRGKMVFNCYICCASFGARWYRIDILAVNILWLYYVDISLSYFPIEFALWANYLSAIWLFVFCSQIVKRSYPVLWFESGSLFNPSGCKVSRRLISFASANLLLVISKTDLMTITDKSLISWPSALKCIETSLDVVLLRTWRKCSRILSPRRLPVSPM